MLINDFLFLLLPIAAATGWYAGFRHHKEHHQSEDDSPQQQKVNRDYFLGLNYLLNDQPDKAVDFFIKMLEVNADTIETHLALGTLFRRRGEVDRAIRVHQNVIARPHLAKEHRVQALSELGMDYLRAGFLDRAEKLFLELIEMNEETESSCNYLLNIYQLQDQWQDAIKMAEKLIAFGKKGNWPLKIAYFYCELAKAALDRGELKVAKEYLKQATDADDNCVRIDILRGAICEAENKFKEAIAYYKKVANKDLTFVSEIILPLKRCYEALDDLASYIAITKDYLKRSGNTLILITLSELLAKLEGDKKATEFLLHVLEKRPSISGIDLLLRFYSKTYEENQDGETAFVPEEFNILQNFTKQLLLRKPNYRCGNCGFSSKVIYWQCPGCKQWTSMKWVD